MPVSRKRKAPASSSSSSRPTRRTRSNRPALNDVIMLLSDSEDVDAVVEATTGSSAVNVISNDTKRHIAEQRLQLLEIRLQNRLALEHALLQEDLEELQQNRRKQMMLLPQEIRRMNFHEFLRQYGMQLELALALESEMDSEKNSTDPTSGSSSSSLSSSSLAQSSSASSPLRIQATNARRMATTPFLKTPIDASSSLGAFTPAPFMTSSRPMPNTVRTVRKGKAVLSHTGSPLTSVQPTLPSVGSIAAIAPPQAPANHPMNLVFRVTEDFALDLLNPKHRAQLTKEGLVSAREQLQQLQKQMELALHEVQSAETTLVNGSN